jgi:hypothetical protein
LTRFSVANAATTYPLPISSMCKVSPPAIGPAFTCPRSVKTSAPFKESSPRKTCERFWRARGGGRNFTASAHAPPCKSDNQWKNKLKAQARARAEQAQREQLRRDKRNAQWEKLCPREYRLTTERDGKTELARLELECKHLPAILAWKFSDRGLVIRSRASGKCKTRAAWRLLRKHWNDGRTIDAFSAGGFQRHAQDEAGKFTLTAWFNNIAVANILFLDDLGKGYWTENTEAVWFDLLEHRTSPSS